MHCSYIKGNYFKLNNKNIFEVLETLNGRGHLINAETKSLWILALTTYLLKVAHFVNTILKDQFQNKHV